MLKIALAPPSVARGEIQQRWRAFFKAAAQGWRHSDRPARSPHQRRFDKSVAEDMPAKRFATAQVGQACILRKCADPDDGIVTPIVAFGAVPPCNARRDQRSVEPPGKLL